MRRSEARRGRRRSRAPPVLARHRKERWSASEVKQLPGAGELDPASPPSCRPPRTAHPPSHPHPHPPEVPTPTCARRVTSTCEPSRSAISAPRPPRNPKPARSRRPPGRRRPDRRRGRPGEPDPRHPQAGAAPQHPAAAEQWPEGLRAPRRARRSRGARALEAPPLGRRPDNAGRATPPAPRPSAPRTRRGRARALPPRRCTAAARSAERGRGPLSLPPSPAAMSPGSPGDCVPLEPTSGPSTPPNPFVHELHLSRLQRIKVRCGCGTSGRPLGAGKESHFRDLAKTGMGIRIGHGGGACGAGVGGAHVGVAGR